MSEAYPYTTEVLDRLVLLLERFDPARTKFKRSNTTWRGDNSPYGLNAKPSAAASIDFPVVEVAVGRTREEARTPTTYGDEQGDEDDDVEVAIVQTYTVLIVHETTNTGPNSVFDLAVQKALKAGGIKLADPNDRVATRLPYVFGWEAIGTERTRERLLEGLRQASRISIPVRMRFWQSDL